MASLKVLQKRAKDVSKLLVALATYNEIENLPKLVEGHRRILRGIYRPSAYYRRIRTFLREYARDGGVRRPLATRADVAAFVRSVVRLGILGRERFHYWTLLSWTLLRRPKLVPLAVTLAIGGYHFRKICEKQLLS